MSPSRLTDLASSVLLVLALLLASCLHWVPEEELDDDDSATEDDDDVAPDDDDSGPDDDDVGPDDDDIAPDDDDGTTLSDYEAHAVALVLVWDDPDGVDDGRPLAGALFADSVMSPSAEEALTEEVFDTTWPLFADPETPRELSAGDHYEVDPLLVGDQLFVNAGATSVPLFWTGAGYHGPDDMPPLPALVDGAEWVLQVPADGSGYGGFHPGPRLPEAAKPEFARMVGDRVHLPAGEPLVGETASGDDLSTDLLLLRANESQGGTAFHVPTGGGIEISADDLPPGMLDLGQGQLAWYRARRLRHDLSVGSLMMVTGRWTEMDLVLLPAGTPYAWTDPPELPRGEPVEFVIHVDGTPIPSGTPVNVQIGQQMPDVVAVLDDGTVLVTFLSGLWASGLHDMQVQWEAGVAFGSVLVVAEPIPCGLTESEPNDLASQAHFFVPGLVACGTIDPPSDLDNYRFTAAVGTTYTFEVLASRLGHPTDPTLALLDMDGNTVVFSDDEGGLLDPILTWAAPAAGQYLLQVASFQNQSGGPDHSYQLLTSQ